MDGADVGGTNFAGARLTGAVLTDVSMEAARLDRTDLTGALRTPDAASKARAEALLESLKDAMAWAESGGVLGQPAILDGEDLRSLGDRLRGFRLPAVSAPGACFVGMDLRDTGFQGANLTGADLRCADLRGADLRGARLSGAILSKADLGGASLAPLPLSKTRSMPASLARAQLRYARMEACDLTGADLSGADLAGADLTQAVVTAQQLAGARVDRVKGLPAASAAA